VKNMVDKEYVDQWLKILLRKLQDAFGQRLLLVVNVGSWARNDANGQSDIDVNVVLDKVMIEDIILYRSLVAEMPDNQLACGFLGGLNEMDLWPRYDLMAFHYGCIVLHGSVPDVLGAVSRRDIFENAMVGLSTINHAVRHCMVYDNCLVASANGLRDFYKATFFVLQGWYLLKYGEYVATRKNIMDRLTESDEKAVLTAYLMWDDLQEERNINPMQTLVRLERWSSLMFEKMATVLI